MDDVAAVAVLCCALWDDNTRHDMERSVCEDMDSGKHAFFLAICGGEAVGFCHASIRTDYVEGSDSSPVGYLEGIFVNNRHRRLGVARQLVAHAEGWAAGEGCREFASDRELDNTASESFHLGVGFIEVNRIVSYIKPISKTSPSTTI